jgi:hypothetical protein
MLTMVRHRTVATDEERRLTMIRKNVANDMEDRQPVLSQLRSNANIIVDKIPQTKNRIWSLLYFCTYPNPWQADFG